MGSSAKQDAFHLRLTTRVDRLKRLIDLAGPEIVIANEVLLVFQAALVLYPAEMGNALGSLLIPLLHCRAGFCSSDDCDNGLGEGRMDQAYCVSCEAKLQAECDELDSDLEPS